MPDKELLRITLELDPIHVNFQKEVGRLATTQGIELYSLTSQLLVAGEDLSEIDGRFKKDMIEWLTIRDSEVLHPVVTANTIRTYSKKVNGNTVQGEHASRLIHGYNSRRFGYERFMAFHPTKNDYWNSGPEAIGFKAARLDEFTRASQAGEFRGVRKRSGSIKLLSQYAVELSES